MTDCILLSHVFINKDEQHKIDAVNFTVQHWRRHNPNAYIILVGHGEIPNKSKEYVDCFIWKQKIFVLHWIPIRFLKSANKFNSLLLPHHY